MAAPASTAPRPAAAAEAAGGKRPTRPLSPDLRTAKRHRANSAQPPLQVRRQPLKNQSQPC